jgi:preprotein translocase subunit SecG
METVVLSIHLILALLLIGVVLLQKNEGAALLSGGGNMQARGQATALTKLTWILAAAFIATSLTLTILATRGGGNSVLDTPAAATEPATTAPAAPAGADLLPPVPTDAPVAPPAPDAPAASAADAPAETAPAAPAEPAPAHHHNPLTHNPLTGGDRRKHDPVVPRFHPPPESRFEHGRAALGALHLHHRRRGFLARQGAGLGRLGSASAGPRLYRAAAQAGPLSERRPRHDVALRTWRGLRHR